MLLAYVGLRGATQLDGGLALVLFGVNAAAALVFGALRALTFRVWTDDRGVRWTQGTLLTVGLWIVLAAIRVLLAIGGQVLGIPAAQAAAELAILLGLTLGGQYVVLWLRAESRSLPTASHHTTTRHLAA